MKKIIFGLSALIGLNQAVMAESSINIIKANTIPQIILYETNQGLVENMDIKRMLMFINQIQDIVMDADPDPQPAIHYDLVVNITSDKAFDDLINAGVQVEIRSACELIRESFKDKDGNYLKPKYKALKAVDCGCGLLGLDYDIAYSKIKANAVFNNSKTCLK